MHAIRFPWPDKALSPNSRTDRRATTGIRKNYREAWWALSKQNRIDLPENAHLSITFHPPDKRKRDLDNMLGAIKYGLDGLALATCGDDYGWSLSIRRGSEVHGGAVVLRVGQEDARIIPVLGTINESDK